MDASGTHMFDSQRQSCPADARAAEWPVSCASEFNEKSGSVFDASIGVLDAANRISKG
jgi:hypothetical protein